MYEFPFLQQVSRALLNKLEGIKADTNVPAPGTARQETLDEAIQQRIYEELNKLRKQEKEVQQQIELALEKENIEKEGKPWFGSKDKGQSSTLLQQELDRVKSQISQFQRREFSSFPALHKAREAVIKCYRCVRAGSSRAHTSENELRTLDCHEQVEEFKKAVASTEKVSACGCTRSAHYRILFRRGSDVAMIGWGLEPGQTLNCVVGDA